jgi:predicted transcriptional regulator
MSVLPYSASVGGAVIKPTEEGVIRHKALSAMEEQTNMQLEQIRKQIELLALQATGNSNAEGIEHDYL